MQAVHRGWTWGLAVAATAAVALGAGATPRASASRAPPVPIWAGASDGSAYVLVRPDPDGRHAEVVAVRRAAGAPPATPPTPMFGQPLVPAEGDTVISRVATAFPLEVLCLDGAGGYLLLDTFLEPGASRLVEARTLEGRVRFQRTAADLFTPAGRAALPRLGDVILWRRARWVSADGRDLVVVTTPGPVLRIALADGADRLDTDLAATFRERLLQLPVGTRAEFAGALEAARTLRPPGLAAVLEGRWARADLDVALALDVAALRLELGPSPAAVDVFVRALAPASPEVDRALALDRCLYRVLPAADAAHRAALAAALRPVGSAEARLAARAFATGRVP